MILTAALLLATLAQQTTTGPNSPIINGSDNIISLTPPLQHSDIELGSWRFNGFINEMQYFIPVSQRGSGNDGWVTLCGAVGRSANGTFYADIVRPPQAPRVGSKPYKTLTAAMETVQHACETR